MASTTAVLRWSRIVERGVTWLALAFAWLALPLLILCTVLNVGGRFFRVGESPALYELGGEVFFVLVMLSFGYAYVRDGHVRVDVFRGRLAPRVAASLELVGCLLIVVPLSGFLVGYGADATATAFVQGERASALGDLPLQWLVKASVPLGFLALLLAAACVTVRSVPVVFGRNGVPPPGRGGVADDPARAGGS